MIEIPTTLVLGAGSSREFEYPLGIELINKLAGQKNKEIAVGKYSAEESKKFLSRLSRSSYYSIDEFLTDNPDLAEIGKLWIARELRSCENLDRLFPPYDSGWYQYLFHRLLHHGKPEFDKSRLSIVTFNYDRSLEAYLFNVLQNRFNLEIATAKVILDSLPIIHVHGMLGKFPDVPYENSNLEDIETYAREIRIISELRDVEDSFCSDEFRQANEAIKNSDRVFFLGFGFHEDNLRKLGVSKVDWTDRQVWSTSHGWSPPLEKDIRGRLSTQGLPDLKTGGHACSAWFQNNQGLE